MEYVNLGETGTRVSRLSLGTWRFGYESDGVVETTKEEAHELLDAARERGVNFIDTADGYGDPGGTAERWIGDWLADHDREEFVIASKMYWPTGDGPNERGLGRKHLRAELENILDRLGTDYLDVLYMHRWDDSTPIAETLRTLDRFVRDGTVNHVGASKMAAWKLTKALWTSDVEGLEPITVTQPHYSAAHREPVAEYVEVCADQDLAVCPFSPLDGGFLTGKYERDGTPPEGSRGDLKSWEDRFSERKWRVLDTVRAIAEETSASAAQVSLRWLMDQSDFTCVPVVGARTVDQLDENVGAVELDLSDEQFDRITDAYAD